MLDRRLPSSPLFLRVECDDRCLSTDYRVLYGVQGTLYVICIIDDSCFVGLDGRVSTLANGLCFGLLGHVGHLSALEWGIFASSYSSDSGKRQRLQPPSVSCMLMNTETCLTALLVIRVCD